jgi:septum formation protein
MMQRFVAGVAANTVSIMSGQAASSIVLGSQSPRREGLLRSLVGAGAVRVLPPTLPAEPGFEDAVTLDQVDLRLFEVARLKFDDVCTQLAAIGDAACVVAADTVVVGLGDDGAPTVLGKPPADEASLRSTVRDWFERFYAGRRHLAKTALCVGWAGECQTVLVTTSVWFRRDAVEFVDWYLGTGEPRGKAGGYAIQESGCLFVERIEGSLSNIIGLPLVETRQLLVQAGAVEA